MARPRKGNKQALARIAEKHFERQMKQLQYLAISAVQKSMVTTAQKVIDKAREYVPVDTGYLRSSAFVDHPRKTAQGIKVEFGFRAHYAAVVESKKPYLAPALAEVLPELRAEVRANRSVLATIRPIRAEI